MHARRTLDQLEKALAAVDRNIASGEDSITRLGRLLDDGQPGSAADTVLAHRQLRLFREVLHTMRSLRSHMRRHRVLWGEVAA